MKLSIVTPLIRRVLWIGALVAAMGLAAVLLSKVLARSTLAFGQKCGDGSCWGYRLEQFRFSKQTTLKITAMGGEQSDFELPKMRVESVNEDRWLAGDRAIYLNFRLKPFDDPSSPGTTLRLIYDFRRGQLYMNSPLDRSSEPSSAGTWLSDAEFQSVLTRIEP